MNKPTIRWRRDLCDDPNFTEDNIREADEILDSYIEEINALKGTCDQQLFENAIRNVVLALNKYGGLNGRYPDLIESWERDELVAFIIDKARSAGYIPSDEDVTFQWRDW